MKFQASALALLLVGTAVAAPANKEQARKNDIHQKLKKLRGLDNALLSKRDGNQNWGGAIVPNTGITQVESTFTIPNVNLAPNDNGSGVGSAWVGIDGSGSCDQVIWQAGGYWSYNNGAWDYVLFYEWYPAPSVVVTGLSVAAGDSITVKVVATSTTSGTAYFTNNANGQTFSGTLTNQPALCQETAEWIVENNNGAGVEMPDFGNVSFTECSYLANGASAGVNGAEISAVSTSGVTYTTCATSGDAVVNCMWQS